MERKRLVTRTIIAALAAGAACVATVSCSNAAPAEPATISLLSDYWKRADSTAPASQLGDSVITDSLPPVADITRGFTISFKAKLTEPTRDRRILEIPDVLEVTLRQHNPLDRDRQNYPAHTMPDGSVPVLEAQIRLVSPVDGSTASMPVGIPLAMLDEPFGEHDITLDFSGPHWTMYVDGRLIDNDFPFGYPDTAKMRSWTIDPDFVGEASITFPAAEFTRSDAPGDNVAVQYWTPAGFNAWVGDVVSLYNDSTYHLFYLYDRRGHQSKLGRGGHYFEHLSTRDFIHWTEHEAAVPIEEQWETFGTGTPFVADGKLCISYGYHTTRLYPYERTTLPQMFGDLARNGHTDTYDRTKLDGIAAGSSYSVSDDGIHFTKTGLLFHPCENPSIYTDPQGRLKMLANYGARGTWEADSVDGRWRCVNENFPTGGDCTFFFNWGDRDYIIGGFTNLWSKPSAAPDSAYTDMVAAGTDFYNGLCVPTISAVSDGRYIMAGWMWVKGWGGPLVIHELVRFPDGRIGTKWMDELIPAASCKPVSVGTGETVGLPAASFMLTFTVDPGASADGKLDIELLPEAKRGVQDGCRWTLDCAEARAQYSAAGTHAVREKSLREGGEPQQGRNYAIENTVGTDKPFTVRMIVKYSPKLDGSIVDTEIAGSRTMLSYREKLKPARLRIDAAGLTVSDIRLVPLDGD